MQPSLSSAKRATFADDVQLIPSWIRSCLWRSSSICCGWSTTSVIRPSSSGVAGASSFVPNLIELMWDFVILNCLS